MTHRLHVVLATAALLVASSGTAVAQHAQAHWTYQGEEGPDHWGALSKEYKECRVGKNQSPINITTAQKAADLPSIQISYHPSPLKVMDNGHTIVITAAPGSSISISGHKYDLKSFHFHHPAEEAFNGTHSPMVAHLVHADAGGHLAVIGVMLDSGSANAVIEKIWASLPTQKNVETSDANVMIDPAGLLPVSLAYYTFQGSLTTPPCSEPVRWLVLRDHTTLSGAQIAQFAAIYPMNARPIQPLNGRVVKESP